jgi:hypothetical protein
MCQSSISTPTARGLLLKIKGMDKRNIAVNINPQEMGLVKKMLGLPSKKS